MAAPTEAIDVKAFANRVVASLAAHCQIPTFSSRPGGLTLAQAYRVTPLLRAAFEARGERITGRKIGFTNREMWKVYGVQSPIWGYTTDRTTHELAYTQALRIKNFVEPRIEPEIMFGLKAAPLPGMSEAALLDCMEWVSLGYEVVQSIFPDWKFAAPDTVAANGVHGALVIGYRTAISSKQTVCARTMLKGHLVKRHGHIHMDKAELFTDGEAYDRMMGRWSRLVGETFLAWLDLPNGLRWLDVGCGNGAFTEEIIARCAPVTVTAIDRSNEQLAFARTRPGAKMAKFEVGDAHKLAFGDGTFDVAIMALVLAFLPDPAKAVEEMARVVRPGGWVATYMWDILNGGSPTTPIYSAIESLGSTLPVRPNPAASRLEAMRGFWEMAGLEAIETRSIRVPVKYADFDDFWDSNTVPVGPQGKVIAGMSPDMREQLRLRLREHLSPTSAGQILYESFANAVRGRVRR